MHAVVHPTVTIQLTSINRTQTEEKERGGSQRLNEPLMHNAKSTDRFQDEARVKWVEQIDLYQQYCTGGISVHCVAVLPVEGDIHIQVSMSLFTNFQEPFDNILFERSQVHVIFFYLQWPTYSTEY